MDLQLEFKRYRRHMRRPLVTHHGFMAERSGLILRLTDAQGRQGYGEVAPLKWFGTESFQDAYAFLASLNGRATVDVWAEVPISLPCVRFAIDCALHMLERTEPPVVRTFPVAALLPDGEAAVESLRKRVEDGYTSAKWKIGVHPAHEELDILKQLLDCLQAGHRLRLDANGALDWNTAKNWMDALLQHPQIEFLEQPFPIQHMRQHRELQDIATDAGRGPVIALDESLNEPSDMSDALSSGWNGLFVCKPLVQGSRDTTERWMQSFPGRVVFSSAFETVFGIEALLELAVADPEPRALGLGTVLFFEDDALRHFQPGPSIRSGTVTREIYQSAWESLRE